MNLPFFIARRYLFSKRKKNFINIISILSMIGVAITTAALIIVLSVFNGLEDLLRNLNSSFDPEIKVQASAGKSFEVNNALIEKLQTTPGVDVVTEVIEDYALLRYRDANQAVRLKGVSDSFLQQKRIPPENIVEGELVLSKDSIDYAIIGRGIQYLLSVSVSDGLFPLQVYYIKNLQASTLDASQLYTRKTIMPGGVFSIVQNFDENYVIVPLHFARDLLNYGNKRTAIEIKIRSDANVYKVEAALQKVLGDDFTVLNHEEQHQDLYRLLKMEKLFAFFALTLLLAIGSLNIFFSLMMLALDKKKDITVLSSMGANQQLIRNIFLAEGSLIAALGTVSGLILGGILCWLQMKYAFISMGMESSVAQGYPVKMEAIDFLLILFVVSVVTFLISVRPAYLASRVVRNEMLVSNNG